MDMPEDTGQHSRVCTRNKSNIYINAIQMRWWLTASQIICPLLNVRVAFLMLFLVVGVTWHFPVWDLIFKHCKVQIYFLSPIYSQKSYIFQPQVIQSQCSRVGFWTPKTCFSQGSGKNLGKAVFPGFWTVFTAQNWENLDLLYDVAFRWWILYHCCFQSWYCFQLKYIK